MIFFRNLPIKIKLIVIVMVISVSTLLISTAIFVTYDLKLMKQDLVRNLNVLASTVGFNSRSTLVFDDPTAAKNYLESLSEDGQIISAALYDSNFSIFVNYEKTGSKFMEPVLIKVGKHLYPDHVEIIQSISLDEKVVGYIYLNADWSQYNKRLKLYMVVVGLILLGVITLSFYLAFRLQNIISSPLRTLASAALKISKSPDYSLRVHHDSDDELGVLFKGFNEMLSQIEKRECELAEYRKHLEEKIVEVQLSGEKLKKSEETTRTILVNAFDAIIVMDSNGVIKNWNKSAETIFGWNSKEVVGTVLAEKIIPQEYREAHEKGLAHFLLTGQGRVLNQQIEMPGLHRSGKQFPVEFSISVTKMDQSCIFTGIIRDITERKQAEQKLLNTQEQLRNLSNKLQSAREEEKARIAREIHDELGQVLTSLKIDLSWVSNNLQDTSDPLIEKIEGMNELIQQTVQMVQRIATELRPRILDIFGICDALAWQAKEFQKRTGIECVLTISPENIQLDPERSIAIFRIYQEALTNVARHAEADHVQTFFLKRDDKIILEICDNGKGMCEEEMETSKSFGLFGIRERVLIWKGEAKILSKEGKGTTISVSIPWDQA